MTKQEATRAAFEGSVRDGRVWVMGEIRTDVHIDGKYDPATSYQPTGEYFAVPADESGTDPRPMYVLAFHYPPVPTVLMEFGEEHYRTNPPGAAEFLATLPAEWFRPGDQPAYIPPDPETPMDVLLSDPRAAITHGPNVRKVNLTLYVKS
jgi:hypothetical protein